MHAEIFTSLRSVNTTWVCHLVPLHSHELLIFRKTQLCIQIGYFKLGYVIKKLSSLLQDLLSHYVKLRGSDFRSHRVTLCTCLDELWGQRRETERARQRAFHSI